MQHGNQRKLLVLVKTQLNNITIYMNSLVGIEYEFSLIISSLLLDYRIQTSFKTRLQNTNFLQCVLLGETLICDTVHQKNQRSKMSTNVSSFRFKHYELRTSWANF